MKTLNLFKSTRPLTPNLLSMLAVVLSTFVLTSCFSEPRKEIEKGIFVGENDFTKELFFTDTTIGNLSSITILPEDTTTSNRILAIGRLGAVYLDKDGKELSKVLFEEKSGLVVHIENGTASNHGFVNYGGGWQPVFVMDEKGKITWKFNMEKYSAPNDLVLVDIDKDGQDEMIVGTNGRGGIYAFDMQKRVVWHQEARNVFSVGVFEENGVEYIIHSDKDGPVVRSLDGEFVRQWDYNLVEFWVGSLSETVDTQVIWSSDNDNIIAYDFYGKKVATKTFPVERASAYCPSSIVGEKGNVVAVTHSARLRTTEMYFVAANDSILYHEVYTATGPIFTEYLHPDESAPSVLVGGENGEVYRYRKAL